MHPKCQIIVEFCMFQKAVCILDYFKNDKAPPFHYENQSSLIQYPFNRFSGVVVKLSSSDND